MNHLDAYAIAAENYAIAFNSGDDVAAALAAWNAQTLNLIGALDAVPKIKTDTIASLINQLQQAQITGIQAYTTANFLLAVEANTQAQNLAEQISDYFAKRLLRR